MLKFLSFKNSKSFYGVSSPIILLLVLTLLFFAFIIWALNTIINDSKKNSISIFSIVRSQHVASIAKQLSVNNDYALIKDIPFSHLKKTSKLNISKPKEKKVITKTIKNNYLAFDGAKNNSSPYAPSITSLNYTFKSGDTFSDILQGIDLSSTQKQKVLNNLSKSLNVLRIKPGHKIQIVTQQSQDNSQNLKRISYSQNTKQIWDITPDKSNKDKFHSSLRELPTKDYNIFFDGVIRRNLYVDSLHSGLSMSLLSKFIEIYSSDIDFQREIFQGDKYSLLYTNSYLLDNGKKVDKSVLLMTTLVNRGKELTFFRYQDKKGRIGYYNQDGQSAKRTIVKTPIDGARISSSFGKRRHPILGFSKQHNGVDFAVPTGTPVYSAGKGIIQYAGRNGGYGVYVLIRHSGGYSTAYAHLSRLSKGIRKGKIINQGQIIAFSGSTGASTGPHLHYEVIKNGSPINPLKIKVPRVSKLTGNELKRFRNYILKITSQKLTALKGNTNLKVDNTTNSTTYN